MKRRYFLYSLAASAAAALGVLRWKRVARWAEAIRSRKYPGPVVALDEQAMKQPGKWAG
ncbi:MAG TPA: hypothetical protein PLI09_24515 [Candidatus Hydrogenedentes bacterium]|nr:hypothetical protein [Candidatus Hydrogenedentota bacterium]